ncbi:MAG: hypothetical protein GX624_00350 [Actinobacteria bacterium]|nr:hypothetical protein [Actinomycetota bacterium]
MQRPPVVHREHVAGLLPGDLGVVAVSHLQLRLRLEGLDGAGVEGDLPATLGRLGFADDDAVFVGDEGPPHGQSPLLEVDVLPLQAPQASPRRIPVMASTRQSGARRCRADRHPVLRLLLIVERARDEDAGDDHGGDQERDEHREHEEPALQARTSLTSCAGT